MEVVHILGPSYCGSTVLGYVLNTGPNVFFGSEVVRATSKYIDSKKAKGMLPRCDACGLSCKYWNATFLSSIEEPGGLSEIYNSFNMLYPEFDFFVDASKSAENFKGAKASKKIISMKHPVRMLASKIFNDRKKLGILTDDYSSIKSILDKGGHVDVVKEYFSFLIVKYSDYLNNNPGAFIFKSDEAHCENFLLFRELELYLGLDKNALSPERFTEFKCHSLGGNRAPVWLSKIKKGEIVKSSERLEFYKSAEAIGDWKIDDKFKRLISEDLLDEISSLDEYQFLCALLGYK